MRLALATVALLVFAAAAPAAPQRSPEPSVVVHSFVSDVRGAGGRLPKAELVEIAESLAPVGS